MVFPLWALRKLWEVTEASGCFFVCSSRQICTKKACGDSLPLCLWVSPLPVFIVLSGHRAAQYPSGLHLPRCCLCGAQCTAMAVSDITLTAHPWNIELFWDSRLHAFLTGQLGVAVLCISLPPAFCCFWELGVRVFPQRSLIVLVAVVRSLPRHCVQWNKPWESATGIVIYGEHNLS